MSCLRDCTAVLAILLCTAPGCKKQKSEAPATPTQSPIANPPPKVDPQPGAAPASAGRGGPDWRDAVNKPDATARKTGKAGVVQSAVDAGPAKKGQDELDAEAKAAALKAVDSALKGAQSSIKRCYDQHGVASGSTTISFRVHRSGYFMTPSVQGVGGKVQRCVGKVLTNIRVRGVKTGSMTITRKIRFQKWR